MPLADTLLRLAEPPAIFDARWWFQGADPCFLALLRKVSPSERMGPPAGSLRMNTYAAIRPFLAIFPIRNQPIVLCH